MKNLIRIIHLNLNKSICLTYGSAFLINGVFEDVLLPENTQGMRLGFKPLARFYWIALVFWIDLLMPVLAHTYFNHCLLSKRKL